MKKSAKFLALFLALTSFLTFTACSAGTAGETEPLESTESETNQPVTEPESQPTAILPQGEVRVVSFNVDANESTLYARGPALVETVLSYDPDSFGVQEARPGWLRYLRQNLTGYDYIGVSADGETPNAGSFGTYIFYKHDKYTVVDSGTFWLSKTTEVPSKYSDTVDCNRSCCWVILEDKETGLRYAQLNAHLDWMDVAATNYQIGLIRDQILRYEAMGLPVFATGDYNTDEGSDTYQIMLQASSISDSKFEAENKINDMGTYPSYGAYDCTKTKPIDFCFVTKALVRVKDYKVIDDQPNGVALSDHYGLFIRAIVQAEKSAYDAESEPLFPAECISVSALSPQVARIEFKAATDRVAVLRYQISVKDGEGNLVYESAVPSAYRDPEPPTAFSVNAVGLKGNTAYEVTVTAIDAFGNQTTTAPCAFRTAAQAVSAAIDAADLFDLLLAENAFSDASANHLAITSCGEEVRISQEGGVNYLVPNGKYNLKISDFKNHYQALGDGFTAEIAIRTGGDINTDQCYLSNMHAGGFGFELVNGVMEFAIRIGGEYQAVRMTVKTNTNYHFVAVYDGSMLYLYANGELTDSKQIGSGMVFATDPGAQYLCVGADSDASGQGEYFVQGGRIYTARLYATAATAGQALWLWEHSVFA